MSNLTSIAHALRALDPRPAATGPERPNMAALERIPQPPAGLQPAFHREAEVNTLSDDFADWLNSGTREAYHARGLCWSEVTRDALLAAYSAGYSKAVEEVSKGFDEISSKSNTKQGRLEL